MSATGDLDTAGNSVTGPCVVRTPGCVRVNYPQVTWGLLYYGAMADPEGTAAALRIAARHSKKAEYDLEP